jgi:DNA-binding NtrC family response regulator
MLSAGWSVRVLTPLGDLKEQSLISALTVLLLALSVLLIGLLAWQRHRRHQEQQRFHQDAQKQLQRVVSLRNADLEHEIKEHKQTETTLRQHIEAFERVIIEQALAESGGVIKQTMELLGLPRKTLYDKMQ